MKSILSLYFCLFGLSLLAQDTGSIMYQETIKLDIQMDDMPGVDIKSMLPESTSFDRVLHFQPGSSLYVVLPTEEPEEKEISSDDGSFRMVFKMDSDDKEAFYTDHGKKEMIHQQTFMGKTFAVDMKFPDFKWKVTGEKIKYLDYECMKATATYDEKAVVAWFTPQLPARIGPAHFGQLPGAVLMISVDDGDREYKATSVTFGELPMEIKAPKEGKKVSEEEFDAIVDEKEKEMMEQMGGDGEGTRIMIRG